MKLIVGLGNPGRRYRNTRHNAGFDVVEELAARARVMLRRHLWAPVRSARASVAGQDVMLVQPQTFMNRSGPGVAAVLRRRGATPGDLIVILDDVELKLGRVRVRAKGSAGGHKGLGSVIEALGTEDFVRVRIGIGPRPSGDELVEHVLTPFTAEERAAMRQAIVTAADAVECIVRDGPDKAMNDFN